MKKYISINDVQDIDSAMDILGMDSLPSLMLLADGENRRPTPNRLAVKNMVKSYLAMFGFKTRSGETPILDSTHQPLPMQVRYLSINVLDFPIENLSMIERMYAPFAGQRIPILLHKEKKVEWVMNVEIGGDTTLRKSVDGKVERHKQFPTTLDCVSFFIQVLTHNEKKSSPVEQV